MDFNPNRPDLVGPEYAPRTADEHSLIRVDTAGKAAAMRVPSTVSETLTQVGSVIQSDTAQCRAMIELLRAGQEVPSNKRTAVLRPTSIGFSRLASYTGSLPSGAGCGGCPWFGAGMAPVAVSDIAGTEMDPDVYALGNAGSIDDIPSVTSDPSTSVIGPIFDVSALSLPGKRILDIRLHIVAGVDPMVAGTDAELLVHLGGIPGLPYTLPSNDLWAPPAHSIEVNSFPRGTGAEYVMSMGEIYPPYATFAANAGQVLTSSAFTGPLAFLIQAKGTHVSGSSGSALPQPWWIRLYQIWCEVDYCDENRLSAKVVTTGTNPGVEAWQVPTVRVPSSGATSFSKVAGSDLTLVVRQPRFGSAPPTYVEADRRFWVPYMRNLLMGGPAGVEQYPLVSLDEDGTVSSLGDPGSGRLLPLSLQLGGGVDSVDSQEYAGAVPNVILGAHPSQTVTGAAAQTYEGVLVVAKYDDAIPSPRPNIVVTLTGGAVPAGTTATATWQQASAFPADPTFGWRVMFIPFDAGPVTLAPATTYTLTAAAGANGFWTFPYLSPIVPVGLSSPTLTGNSSYGGPALHSNTDVFTDVPMLLYSEPDAVTGLTAVAGHDDTTASGGDCSIPSSGFVTVDWEPSAEGQFAFYEVQRSDAATAWATIARPTDRRAVTVVDREGRVGVQSCYRVRVVSTIGLASPWTATVCATRPGFGAGLYLTSNAWSGALAYKDTSDTTGGGGFADRTFDNPEAAEVVDREVYGADGQVSFIPAERRFSQFKRRLMLYDLAEPAFPTQDVDSPLRDFSRAALPYVCVCDAAGNRWFCNVKVGTLTVRRPGPFFWVDAEFDENTRLPYPVDATAPPLMLLLAGGGGSVLLTTGDPILLEG